MVEMFCDEEKLGDRVEYLEEEASLLKVQNVELTKHLNMVIKKVNDLQAWIKEHWQSCKLACDEEFDFDEIGNDESDEMNPSFILNGRT